jgi:RNA 2',3'-cyclic 3'-phosphodiesterase
VRAFIAVQLPVELKAKLSALQRQLRSLPAEIAWVSEAGIHLTLKFLGEVEEAQLGPVVSCLSEVAQRSQPFHLTVSGIGVFPHESAPRVLWVGIEDRTGLLVHLQHALASRLAQVGYRLDGHSYTPHLTLARLKRVSRRDEFQSLLKAHQQLEIGQLNVGEIELMESRLHASGARYSTVKAMPLGAITR